MSYRFVLWTIGLLLSTASRYSKRVQSQLSRDMTIVLASEEGVARSYVIKNRRLTSHAGASTDVRSSLTFRTNWIGTCTLLAPDTIGRIVDGLGTGDVKCTGQASHIMWIYELTMGLNPFQRNPRDVWPHSYTKPSDTIKAADRIIREPATPILDAVNPNVHERCADTLIWQVARGGPVFGEFTNHNIVVDMTTSDSEASQ